jgi:hypothetical protein
LGYDPTALLGNDAHQWRRVNDAGHETGTESRRPVNEPG